MHERTRPEGGIASYEHYETDKRFSFRISQEEAVKKLEEIGFDTNSLKGLEYNQFRERNRYNHKTLAQMAE